MIPLLQKQEILSEDYLFVIIDEFVLNCVRKIPRLMLLKNLNKYSLTDILVELDSIITHSKDQADFYLQSQTIHEGFCQNTLQTNQEFIKITGLFKSILSFVMDPFDSLIQNDNSSLLWFNLFYKIINEILAEEMVFLLS
jgi:hypothetical protein